MRIWYCEKHKAESKGAIGGVEHSECWRSWAMKVPDISCQLVPMRLIPDNEETVDREALAAALEDADYRLEQGNSISPPYVDRTLLALAAAARTYLALVGETP